MNDQIQGLIKSHNAACSTASMSGQNTPAFRAGGGQYLGWSIDLHFCFSYCVCKMFDVSLTCYSTGGTAGRMDTWGSLIGHAGRPRSG